MEYLTGALVAIIFGSLLRIVFNKILFDNYRNEQQSVIKYSQSHVYSLVGQMLYDQEFAASSPDSQSSRYYDKAYTRVVVAENKAYWIKDNIFFVADLIGNEVNHETARQVDTMAMDDVELKKMIFIVEALTGGDNDSRSSG